MVSRAEFAITSLFTIVFIAFATVSNFAGTFASWTGWSDPLLVNIGATGTAWFLAICVAGLLLLLVKRNKH